MLNEKNAFKKVLAIVLGLALIFTTFMAMTVNVNAVTIPSKKIVGYYVNWAIYRGHDEYYPQYIPFDKITHINYAFATIANGQIALSDPFADTNKMFDGDTSTQPLKGCFHQFEIYKQQYPHFKLLMSIGGWSMSAGFSDVALTDASRTLFADSCVNFIRQYPVFDGIDIDWEYPVGGGLPTNICRPEDKQNFTLLMAKLREKLNAAGAADGRQYLLTAAMPAGYDIMNNYEINLLHQYVDWFNLMTYDYNGAFNTMSNHHSPLYANPNDLTADIDKRTKYNTDWTVNAYLGLGVPASKLNIGSPYYSRGWAGVTGGTNGLFGTATGGAPGMWDDRGTNAGINPFYYVKATLETDTAYVKYRDAYSKVPWLWSAGKKVMYTYEDETSIAEKGQYVIDKGLGGLMFWEFSGDYPIHGNTLTTVIYNKFISGAPAATPTPTPTSAPTATPNPNNTPTPTPMPTPPPGTAIFSDGFESGNFTTGGWTISGAAVQNGYKNAGTYGCELNNTDTITKAVSTVGKTTVQVSYARMTRLFETGSDHLYAEWFNGSSWQLIEDVSATTAWGTTTVTLPAAAANNASFQIRFRTDCGGPDYGYVDDVQISAN